MPPPYFVGAPITDTLASQMPVIISSRGIPPYAQNNGLTGMLELPTGVIPGGSTSGQTDMNDGYITPGMQAQ